MPCDVDELLLLFLRQATDLSIVDVLVKVRANRSNVVPDELPVMALLQTVLPVVTKCRLELQYCWAYLDGHPHYPIELGDLAYRSPAAEVSFAHGQAVANKAKEYSVGIHLAQELGGEHQSVQPFARRPRRTDALGCVRHTLCNVEVVALVANSKLLAEEGPINVPLTQRGGVLRVCL